MSYILKRLEKDKEWKFRYWSHKEMKVEIIREKMKDL